MLAKQALQPRCAFVVSETVWAILKLSPPVVVY
jgi:hypothetical protein